LQCKITAGSSIQTCARFRLIKRNEDGGEGAYAIWNEQIAIVRLITGDLHANFVLREVFAALGFEVVDLRSRDRRRPFADDRLPVVDDLAAPALPVVCAAHRRSIVEEQRRAIGAKLIAVLCWRIEVLLKRFPASTGFPAA
jgi:hypothetical protein